MKIFKEGERYLLALMEFIYPGQYSTLGFRVWGSGFRVSGFGFRVSGVGCWVLGFGVRRAYQKQPIAGESIQSTTQLRAGEHNSSGQTHKGL